MCYMYFIHVDQKSVGDCSAYDEEKRHCIYVDHKPHNLTGVRKNEKSVIPLQQMTAWDLPLTL